MQFKKNIFVYCKSVNYGKIVKGIVATEKLPKYFDVFSLNDVILIQKK